MLDHLLKLEAELRRESISPFSKVPLTTTFSYLGIIFPMSLSQTKDTLLKVSPCINQGCLKADSPHRWGE